MNVHPLTALMAEWLPDCDFAVLNHGFVTHGRDYQLIIQDCISGRPGTHRLTFTHVVRADCQTALAPSGWSTSWDDVFLDWERSKDMDGYIWGTNWSNAYPGITALNDDAEASDWGRQIGRPMYAATLETDRFKLRLIFHAVRSEKIDDDSSLIRQVIIPLKA
ncbi:hypothetical protein [uncultured Brevundimonas sp.]|uniref:YxiG-like protein n=1 Tax=uncultured Brevundimonas sp. TaxID=213418 RepID=UPI0030EE3C88|tara:strand:- start:74 stop:562 length:489 start_codon:yes stop_codon:yes gene_type:complete